MVLVSTGPSWTGSGPIERSMLKNCLAATIATSHGQWGCNRVTGVVWPARQEGRRDNPSSVVAGLVSQLESGSARAESRLTSLYASGVPEVTSAILNDLARSAAAGSPYALELLLGLITEYRLATVAIERHVRSTTMAEEVEQDVLIAVARSIHRYRGESQFTTWLYALARNTAISEVRRHKPTTAMENEADYGSAEQRRVSSLIAERDLIREAVLSLPEVFRETVLLRDVERLSYSEIAERQGLTINTVRSRLSRGRAQLAARLPNQPTS